MSGEEEEQKQNKEEQDENKKMERDAADVSWSRCDDSNKLLLLQHSLLVLLTR